MTTTYEIIALILLFVVFWVTLQAGAIANIYYLRSENKENNRKNGGITKDSI